MKNEKTNKSILEESLIDFKQIQEMMSENSTAQIKDIINGSVKKELKNIITEANDFEEDELGSEEEGNEGMDDISPEGGDLENEGEPEGGEEFGAEGDAEGGEEFGAGEEGGEDAGEEFGAEGDTEGGEEFGAEGDADGDFDFDNFKTGEDEYDLTNNSIEDVVKVFKRIDDSDSIIVKKLEKGKIEIKDDASGVEYLIDLGEGGGTEEGDDETFEIDLDDEEGAPFEESYENGITEDVEVELEGDEDKVDEKPTTQSIGMNRRPGTTNRVHLQNAPGANNRDGAKLIANESKLKEAYARKLEQIEEAYSRKLKTITEEIDQYKGTLLMFRDKLKENAVLNNNLAKYVKLVTENATTKDEKLAFLKRFSEEANTIEAGNKLFESINSNLNKNEAPSIGINIEKQFSVSGPQKINEQVIYQSKDLQDTIGLIKRMNSLR